MNLLLLVLFLKVVLAGPFIKEFKTDKEIKKFINPFASEHEHLVIISKLERGVDEAEIMEDPIFNQLDPNFYCECNDSTIFYTAVAVSKFQMATALLKRGADPLRRVARGKNSVFGLLFEQAIISHPKDTVLPLLEELLINDRSRKALLEGKSSKTTIPYLSYIILSPYRLDLLQLVNKYCELSVANAIHIFQAQAIFAQICNQMITAAKTQKATVMSETIWELTMNQKMIEEIDHFEYAAYDRAATELFSGSLQRTYAHVVYPRCEGCEK